MVSNLELTPLSIKHLEKHEDYEDCSNLLLTASTMVLKILGTEMKIVGLTTMQSSFNFLLFPEEVLYIGKNTSL
jgi:hypothetical protein